MRGGGKSGRTLEPENHNGLRINTAHFRLLRKNGFLGKKIGTGLEIERPFLYLIFYGDYLALSVGSYATPARRRESGIDLASST